MTPYKFNIISVWILFFLLPIGLFSQNTKIVKYGNEFLNIGIGGRALGIGSASVASSNDVTAGYWNPAGLSYIQYPEFTLQHDERFGDLVNYDYGAIAYPFDSVTTFGFSVIRLGVDGVPDTRNALIDVDGNGVMDNVDRLDYSKITYHNTADWGFFLSYAKKTSEDFSWGGNVKFIYRSIISNSGFGIGFDVGMRYKLFDNFSFGANLQDATTTFVSWNTGSKEIIPPNLKFGAAYSLNIFNGVLTPLLDFNVRFENRKTFSTFNLGPVSFDMCGGFEFNYKRFLSLRIGYNDIKQITLGLGLIISKLDIDYAFAKFGNSENDLGNTHRISIKFTLEHPDYLRK